LTVSSREAF